MKHYDYFQNSCKGNVYYYWFFILDLVSEYQQYQDATIDDDEYFEGDEVEQEEAWTTGNSSMMQSPTPTPCRQTHENIETADELYLILPSFFPVF